MMIWELGYLKSTTLTSRRFRHVLWRRKDELLEAGRSLIGRGSFVDRISDRFAQPADREGPVGTARS
jgi:hypothetical protein